MSCDTCSKKKSFEEQRLTMVDFKASMRTDTFFKKGGDFTTPPVQTPKLVKTSHRHENAHDFIITVHLRPSRQSRKCTGGEDALSLVLTEKNNHIRGSGKRINSEQPQFHGGQE